MLAASGQVFAMDLRSLAALRIGTGAILIYDLCDRARFLEDHYTDFGVLPRATALKLDPTIFSLHLAGGTVWFQALLFAIALVAGLFVVLGYRTRAATVVSWVLALSLQNRNAAIFHTADLYLRLLVFWQIFLPTHRAFSLDGRLAQRKVVAVVEAGPSLLARIRAMFVAEPTGATTQAEQTASFATLGLILQVLIVYLMTAWYKASGGLKYWWTSGSMLSLVLRDENYATALGGWVARLPSGMLVWMSRYVFTLESVGPWLILLTFRFPRIRTALIVNFVLFHLGTSLLMQLGLFPAVSMTAWLAFLPSAFWRTFKVASTRPNVCPNVYRGRAFRLAHALPLLPIAVVLSDNLEQLTRGKLAMPEVFGSLGATLGLAQAWSMFSIPRSECGWLVIPGRFGNGKEIDLLTGKPVTWQKPKTITETDPSDRWRTYFARIYGNTYGDHRDYYAGYLCRVHNRGRATPQDGLKSFEIWYMQIDIPEGQAEAQPPQKVQRYSATCEDGYY